MNWGDIVTVVSTVLASLGGFEFMKWLFTRRSNKRIAAAQANSKEIEVETDEFHLLRERLELSDRQLLEKEQRFYEKLGIRSWKDKVWELGGLGGFSKSKITDPNDPEFSRRFLVESYKGEVDHIIGMFIGFTVIFIFPLKFAWLVGVPVAIVNLVLNYMPIMILRYNTPKLKVLHKRALRNQQNKQNQETQQKLNEETKDA